MLYGFAAGDPLDVPCESSSGYVAHILNAALWCAETSQNCGEAVLKVVNLGKDADTTARWPTDSQACSGALRAYRPRWLGVSGTRSFRKTR